MGINVAPKTLHWKRKNCKGKYANYSYFIPRNVKLPFIVSRYEPRQKSLETVHQNGAKKIAYIKIEVGKQEYKELFKLVKDDDRIQLIKGRDTAIGHETFDTDPPFCKEQRYFQAECYVLKQDRYQIEMLTNLDKIPERGAIIFCIFVKQTNGTGFPVRCFAICPNK